VQQAADALINLASQDAPNQHQLDVPWQGHRRDDGGASGPTCLCMWLNYLGHNLTIENIDKATGLGKGFKYTSAYNLIASAKVYGLALRRIARLDMARIWQEIDAEHPLIALVHYQSLPGAMDDLVEGSHWILITGYNDKHVFYNDPYAADDHGKAIGVTNAAFEKASTDCSLDGDTPRQALVAG
jgi:ABC-type bacteriocin/lantibiotic exporter with double-glycine peptidase domain